MVGYMALINSILRRVILLTAASVVFRGAHGQGCDSAELARRFTAAGLVNVRAIDSAVTVELKYATTDNFLHADLYGGLCDCYLQSAATAMLAAAQRLLRQQRPGYALRLWDCSRPQSAQRRMWELVRGTPQQLYVASPQSVSMHSYGVAVDVTIVDEKGEQLDMGTPFDCFDSLAQPRYEEQRAAAGTLTAAHVANRRLLRSVMRQAGWISLASEWWHFNACTRREAAQRFRPIP
jgi:D-alanyl-D-alanine dipeptidase